MTNFGTGNPQPVFASNADIRRMAVEAVLMSRDSGDMTVDEMLAEADKIASYIETGNLRGPNVGKMAITRTND